MFPEEVKAATFLDYLNAEVQPFRLHEETVARPKILSCTNRLHNLAVCSLSRSLPPSPSYIHSLFCVLRLSAETQPRRVFVLVYWDVGGGELPI